jgi:nitroimidazol reductase NimA-like FMN-containing flavoprotein (pyridoxamine 5'-phosphate oxidase superfamily)
MDEPISVMTTEEAWGALRAEEFGRLAFHLGDQVHITPVNYAVDHDPVTDKQTLLFRTAEGSKLLGIVMNDDVAFEIDKYDEDHAMSVIARGKARKLEEDEEHRADNLPLRPWVATEKYNVVEIDVTDLSGRRFELTRPWLHLMPPHDD